MQTLAGMFASLLTCVLASTPLAVSDSSVESTTERARLALTFDVGVPEGAGPSVAFAVLPMLRLQVGVAYNAIAPGIRGGAMLTPFASFVRPTLSVHAGHFEPGDARGLVEAFSDSAFARSPLLNRLQYDFVSGHLGVEVGRQSGTFFFVRGGLSRSTLRLGGFGSFLQQAFADPSASAVTPTLTVTAPSLQLGFVVPLY